MTRTSRTYPPPNQTGINTQANAADAHKLSARFRGEQPGRGKEAEKEAEALGRQVGAKIDSAVRSTPSIVPQMPCPL